ncbi:hypothetical protein BKA70DRAFT_1260475 [Coprinopsis sp. MPI-PUGE-AT-0042]|nr:hypothetical protein BKA70DRAFT_1260475 [Coprinopsis sp. MPI-PUGE-AT-0042]
MAGPVRHPPARSRRQSPANLDSPSLLTALPQSIPRPPNAWILYRSDRLKSMAPLPEGQKRAQSTVSKQLSLDWANESQEVRDRYEKLADQRKAEHHVMYPNYRFTPMKKEEKAALREAKKKAREEAKKLRGRARGRRTASAQQQPPPEPQQQQPLLPVPPHTMSAVPYFPAELFGAAGPSPPISAASSPEPVPDSESPSDLSKASTPDLQERPSSAPMLTLPHPLVAAPQGPPSANPYMAYFRSGGTELVYTQPDAMTSAGRSAVDYQQQQVTNQGPSEDIPQLHLPNDTLDNNVDYGNDGQLEDWMQSMPQQQNETLTFNVDPNMFQGFEQTNAFLDMSQFNDGGVFDLGMFDPNMLSAEVPGDLVLNFDNFATQSDMDFYQMLNMPENSVLSDPTAANDVQQQFNVASASLPEAPQFTAPNPDPNQYMGSYSLPVPQDTPTSSSSLSPALSVDLSNTENTQKTSYVPPSGAAMSSTRRVGGRWKPPISVDEGSFDNYQSHYVRAS